MAIKGPGHGLIMIRRMRADDRCVCRRACVCVEGEKGKRSRVVSMGMGGVEGCPLARRTGTDTHTHTHTHQHTHSVVTG